MKKGLEGNIWKFGIHSVTNKRTYMTFLTIFLLTMPNATARTIGLLTLVGQIAGFIFEVPSGYLADRIGHKITLVLARASMAVSTALYIVANQSWYFFLATVFLSLGWALSSGTTTAFMQDTLANLGREEEYARIMGKVRSIGFAIPVAVIILLAAIAENSFRTAFLVALVIDVIGLLAVLSFQNPQTEIHPAEALEPDNFMTALRAFFHTGWLPYIFVGVLLSGIYLGATIGFKNPYQELLGFSITTLGILWALSRVLISALLPFNGWIQAKLSFKQFLVLEASVIGLSFVGVGLTNNIWLVAFFFVISNVPIWGLSSARNQYLLSLIKDSNMKATLLSIKELLNKIVTGIFALLMGSFVLGLDFRTAYFITGSFLVLLLFAALLFLPRVKEKVV